jgi:hypothetical protein
MQSIKTIKNFIPIEDAYTLIEYIDQNLHSFSSDRSGLWFKKFFGIDDIYKHGKGEPIIDCLGNIKELSVNIVEDVKNTMSEHFNDPEPIFLNSFWFAKHLPGDNVLAHVDTEDGYNQQFVYSAILYLNTVQHGGVLDFPNLNLSFKPEACDLIIFPSNGEEMLHEVMGIGEDRYTLPMWFTKDKALELKFAGN